MTGMPFNRESFDEALTLTFAQACRNVERDGRAYSAIHAFDKRGAVAAMLLEVGPDVANEDRAAAEKSGIVLVEGPFRDRLKDLTGLFTKIGAVAAIYIAEAWKAPYVEGDTRPPSQREDREEVLTVQGAWPAQVYERALIARIVRDASGTPTTRPFPDDMGEHFSVGWLAECLPGLPERRPQR